VAIHRLQPALLLISCRRTPVRGVPRYHNRKHSRIPVARLLHYNLVVTGVGNRILPELQVQWARAWVHLRHGKRLWAAFRSLLEYNLSRRRYFDCWGRARVLVGIRYTRTRLLVHGLLLLLYMVPFLKAAYFPPHGKRTV